MKIEEVKKTLAEIGLSEKEVEAYLALLKVGETTAAKIAQEINIERTLTYYVLEKLINKGLASFKLRNNVKYYSAADAEKILEELKEKEKSFTKILPYLQALEKKPYEEEVKVDVFKGIEGLKAIMNDMFKAGREFLVFGEQGQIQKNYPILYKQYLRRLQKTGIKEKVLVRDDLKGKLWKSKNTSFKYLPKEVFSPTTTLIYDNKIQITIWEKPMYNILISSKKIADSFKAYFNYFWKTAYK